MLEKTVFIEKYLTFRYNVKGVRGRHHTGEVNRGQLYLSCVQFAGDISMTLIWIGRSCQYDSSAAG